MILCYFPTKSIQLETISTTFSQFNQSFTKWAYTRKMSNKFFQKLIYNMINVVFKSYLHVFLLAQNFFKLLSYGTKVYDILKQYGIVQ